MCINPKSMTGFVQYDFSLRSFQNLCELFEGLGIGVRYRYTNAGGVNFDEHGYRETYRRLDVPFADANERSTFCANFLPPGTETVQENQLAVIYGKTRKCWVASVGYRAAFVSDAIVASGAVHPLCIGDENERILPYYGFCAVGVRTGSADLDEILNSPSIGRELKAVSRRAPLSSETLVKDGIRIGRAHYSGWVRPAERGPKGRFKRFPCKRSKSRSCGCVPRSTSLGFGRASRPFCELPDSKSSGMVTFGGERGREQAGPAAPPQGQRPQTCCDTALTSARQAGCGRSGPRQASYRPSGLAAV